MDERKIRRDRAEDEACERGTIGCCIDHTAERRAVAHATMATSCEHW